MSVAESRELDECSILLDTLYLSLPLQDTDLMRAVYEKTEGRYTSLKVENVGISILAYLPNISEGKNSNTVYLKRD